MIGEPFYDIWMPVCAVVVVYDGVNEPSGRKGALHGIEEASELLVPMLAHAASDHGSVENAHGSKKPGRTVAFVIMGQGPTSARLQRQRRLGAMERLNLALLVDRDDDGVSWRIPVEADDVLDLLGEFGIAGALECADAMRLEAIYLPQTGRCEAERQRSWPCAAGQWVASPGGSEQVSSNTLAVTLAASGALLGLRVSRVQRAKIVLFPAERSPVLEWPASITNDAGQTFAIFGRDYDVADLSHVARDL